MKLMGSLPLVVSCVLPFGRCWRSSLSLSSFTGPYSLVMVPQKQKQQQQPQQQRSFAAIRQSNIFMMPEGPEVRTVVDQLQGGVGRRLVDIQFLSGRYVRHGRPKGFAEFAATISPISNNEFTKLDIIEEWNTKGKFIYITLDHSLDEKQDSDNSDIFDDDFLRSIWITLGMTGQFVNEKIHETDPRFARWYIETLDVQSGSRTRVFYHDQRNFGVLKFSLSRKELVEKLHSLGPDILNPSTGVDDFLQVVSRQRPTLNVCKFLMDQSKIAGVGNYILSESLYRSNIDPFASLDELTEAMLRNLFDEIQKVANESYASQGLTRRDGGTFRNFEGSKGKFEFQLQCYGREKCAKGNDVIKETQGPHKRAIWYTAEQLFVPRKERYGDNKRDTMSNEEAYSTSSNPYESDEQSSDGDDSGRLIDGLVDEGWKKVLSEAIESDRFQSLEHFIEQERASGATIYPPQSDIFSALNLCPFEKVKVVICGQDPYHGPGQGHGLAFSVRLGVTPPPSLKNIFREVVDDIGIKPPAHGNLFNWARQGVLLLNTVMTVRRGEANSHSKQGWEEFTDAVIRAIDEKNDGVVFLLWGNPAQQKAKTIDETKHVVIRTSHPSPLGATKTKSPFLGSRCFGRANQGLIDMGKEPVDWTV